MKLSRLFIGTTLFPLALLAQNAALPPAPAKKIHVLIVTGDDVPAHDWRATTPVVREILEGTRRFEVRVSEEPEVLATPALARYDLVILNYRDGPGREASREAGQNLADFVARGKGLVAIHFAVNAFRDWKEYQDLVGRVWVPKVSGHGPRGPFQVTIARKDHPITEGLGDFEIDDELYAALAGTKELNVLATAHSHDFSKRVEPMAWTLEHGKGRVFATPLGHDTRARRHPAFSELLRRGAE